MSSSISITTKSTGNMNLLTLTKTSYATPYGYFIDMSARCNVIRVSLTSRSPIFRSIDKGIKFVLAPRSSNAFPTNNVRIVTGIVKLLGSLDL